MPHKDLLENQPLYRRVEIVLPIGRHEWPRPAIVARCQVCGGSQTYTMISDYAQYDEAKVQPGPGGVYPPYSTCIKVAYECAGCRRQRRYFLLLVFQHRHPRPSGLPPETAVKTTVQKVGQFPAWDIAPDPQLAKKLGARVDVYKRGLVCESQSYGIGAFAYYRRIVEQVIDELLADIAALVSTEGREDYASALARAKDSHRATDKIDHVKDLVPPVLRPGGVNPLVVLHGALSVGLHRLSDDDCLERAAAIRGALVFLVAQVNQSKASAEQFRKDLLALVQRQAQSQALTDSGPDRGPSVRSDDAL